MRLKPKFLAMLIISSFVLLVVTNGGASEPDTALGIVFWLSFGVFASCVIHLSKNERYYSKYIDEHFR